MTLSKTGQKAGGALRIEPILRQSPRCLAGIVWPGWLPGFCGIVLMQTGEAYPVYLDIEELDGKWRRAVLSNTKIESPIVGYELTAKVTQQRACGLAVTVVCVWQTLPLVVLWKTARKCQFRNDWVGLR